MGLVVKEGPVSEPIPAGTHHAICYRIWDLGTQPGGKWDPKRQILIAWELPEQRIEIEETDLPKSLSRRFTNSLHKKSALRPFLEMWRGKPFSQEELEGFDLENLLGANCMLQVMHKDSNGRTFANITAALPLMQGYEKRNPENTAFCWGLTDGDIPKQTPDWIRGLIEGSQEYTKTQDEIWQDDGPKNDDDEGFDDDIPF